MKSVRVAHEGIDLDPLARNDCLYSKFFSRSCLKFSFSFLQYVCTCVERLAREDRDRMITFWKLAFSPLSDPVATDLVLCQPLPTELHCTDLPPQEPSRQAIAFSLALQTWEPRSNNDVNEPSQTGSDQRYPYRTRFSFQTHRALYLRCDAFVAGIATASFVNLVFGLYAGD